MRPSISRRDLRWAASLLRASRAHLTSAEGLLGVAALLLAVWLFWPQAEMAPPVDYRKAWQESLAAQNKARLEAVVGFAGAGVHGVDRQIASAPAWVQKLPPARRVPGTEMAHTEMLLGAKEPPS